MCQLREKNITTTSALLIYYIYIFKIWSLLVDWCLFLKAAREKPTQPLGCLVCCSGTCCGIPPPPPTAWPQGSIRDRWGGRQSKMVNVASRGHQAAMCGSFSPITWGQAGSFCEVAIAEMISYGAQPLCWCTSTGWVKGGCLRIKASRTATESFPCQSLHSAWNNTEEMHKAARTVWLENLQTRSDVCT